MEDSEILSLVSDILEKLIPTFQKDTLNSPSGPPKSLINSVSTHFESLEKSVEIKDKNEFEAKRFRTLKKMIANDRILLDSCVKSIQDALSEGWNVYKSSLSFSHFFADVEKKIVENKKTLAGI